MMYPTKRIPSRALEKSVWGCSRDWGVGSNGGVVPLHCMYNVVAFHK